MSFEVTLFKSVKALGKHFGVKDGEVVKLRTQAGISRGTATRCSFSTLEELAAFRAELTTSHALGYGVCEHAVAEVVTKDALPAIAAVAAAAGSRPAVARDGSHFSWPEGPGVLMLDYDPAPDESPLKPEDLVATLRHAVPELATADLLWTPSTSSNIWHRDEAHVGLRGAHVYVVVNDAKRIPEVGRRIFDRIALAGHARILISDSGRMLQRTLIDLAVFQPERLDFLRATCIGDELEQHLMEPRLFKPATPLHDGLHSLDAASLAPLTEIEVQQLESVWGDLEAKAAMQAKAVRARWALERAKESPGADAPDYDLESAAHAFERAAACSQLPAKFLLRLHDGRRITVQEMMDAPEQFDGAKMADPYEPGYGGADTRIATAYLHPAGDRPPVIHSHAHGGTIYSVATAESDLRGVVPEADSSVQPANAMRGDPVIDPKDITGMARSLAQHLYEGPRKRFLLRWQGGWYEHRGTYYREVPAEAIESAALLFLDRCRVKNRNGDIMKFHPQPSQVAGVVTSLGWKSLAAVETVPAWPQTADFDHWPATGDANVPADDALVALSNGLLNLRTRTLLPHTHRYFNLNALPFPFDPEATCPAWLDFIDSVWPTEADARACLQEWLGYLVSGSTRHQKMLTIIGPTRSGKGIINSVLTALLGPDNVAAPALDHFTQQFGLAQMIGKSAAVIADARDAPWNQNNKVVERLLNITGEDTVTIDRKNRDAWVGRLGCRLVMMSNEVPKLAESSGALLGRCIMLRMHRSFLGKEDLGLRERLLAELPGIFNWALEGLARLTDRGYLVQPDSGKALVDDMARMSNPVAAFVDDRCIVAADTSITKDDLYDDWRGWCSGEGKQPGSKEVFMRNLVTAIPTVVASRPTIDGQRVHTLLGIGRVPATAAGPLDFLD